MDRRCFIQSSMAFTAAAALNSWTSPLAASTSKTPGGCAERSTQHFTRIFGIGGAGCNIVDQWSDLTCPRPLRIGRIEEKRELDLRLVSTDLSELCPDDAKLISQAVAGSQLTVVVAGLGGTTGSCIAPYLLRQTKLHGGDCVAVYCRPFSFEGWERRTLAMQAISSSLRAIDRDRVLVFGQDESRPEATLSEILACTDARMITAIVQSYLAWLSSPHDIAAAMNTEG